MIALVFDVPPPPSPEDDPLREARRLRRRGFRYLLLMGVALCLAIAMMVQNRRADRTNPETSTSSMFHEPATGCPAGTELVPDMFARDGVDIPGCFNPDGDGSVDIIRPRELVRMRIPIPAPIPEGPRI